jgi:hypothetical protein
VFKADGTRFGPASWPLHRNHAAPVIVDVDGDDYPELVVAEDSDLDGTINLKALSRTGTLVKTWRQYGMEGRRATYVRASVGEFTGDGLTDIALHIPLVEGSGTVINGGMSVLTLQAPFMNTRADWPMLDADPQGGSVRLGGAQPTPPPPPPDAAVPDMAPLLPPVDAAVRPVDAPALPVDAPVVSVDAPVRPVDAPVVLVDAPVGLVDAPVRPVDARVVLVDAPVAPETAAALDAGVAGPDARPDEGSTDAAATVDGDVRDDAGAGADARTVDAPAAVTGAPSDALAAGDAVSESAAGAEPGCNSCTLGSRPRGSGGGLAGLLIAAWAMVRLRSRRRSRAMPG